MMILFGDILWVHFLSLYEIHEEVL
jgi:hypothetical protein